MSISILRIREVVTRTGMCRASIYNAMAAGTFPRSIAITATTVGWPSDEVDAWIARRIRDSRVKQKAIAQQEESLV